MPWRPCRRIARWPRLPPPESSRHGGHARARPRTEQEDEELRDGIELGLTLDELSESMELPTEVLAARLAGLGLEAGKEPPSPLTDVGTPHEWASSRVLSQASTCARDVRRTTGGPPASDAQAAIVSRFPAKDRKCHAMIESREKVWRQ